MSSFKTCSHNFSLIKDITLVDWDARSTQQVAQHTVGLQATVISVVSLVVRLDKGPVLAVFPSCWQLGGFRERMLGQRDLNEASFPLPQNTPCSPKTPSFLNWSPVTFMVLYISVGVDLLEMFTFLVFKHE